MEILKYHPETPGAKSNGGGFINRLNSMSQPLIEELERWVVEESIDVFALNRYSLHPRVTLLRFLRTWNFDLAKAKKNIKDNIAWRAKNNVDALVKEDPEAILGCKMSALTAEIYPHWHCQYDKTGRPVLYKQFGRFKATDLKKLTGGSFDQITKYHIWECEVCAMLCRSQSLKLGYVVEAVTVVLDLKGMSMSQITGDFIGLMKALSDIDQDNYPEMLSQLFIINAPASFSIVWRMVKTWVSPSTTANIRIFKTPEQYEPVLRHYIGASHLPLNYGGDLPQLDMSVHPYAAFLSMREELLSSAATDGFAETIAKMKSRIDSNLNDLQISSAAKSEAAEKVTKRTENTTHVTPTTAAANAAASPPMLSCSADKQKIEGDYFRAQLMGSDEVDNERRDVSEAREEEQLLLAKEIYAYNALYEQCKSAEERAQLLQVILTKERQRTILLQSYLADPSGTNLRFEVDSSDLGVDIDSGLERKRHHFLHCPSWVATPQVAGLIRKRSNWIVHSFLSDLGFLKDFCWTEKWVAMNGAELVYMAQKPTMHTISKMKINKSIIDSNTIIDQELDDTEHFGFSLHFHSPIAHTWYFRASSQEEKQTWLYALSKTHSVATMLDSYKKTKLLGMGTQHAVHEVQHSVSGSIYAMKQVRIKNDHQLHRVLAETKILQNIAETVDSPNILKINKVLHMGSDVYVIMPLLTGGDVYEHIIRRGHFTEHDSALLVRDIVGALHAMHAHGVLHLNITPENLLFDSPAADGRIVLTDFGLSKVLADSRAESMHYEYESESVINNNEISSASASASASSSQQGRKGPYAHSYYQEKHHIRYERPSREELAERRRQFLQNVKSGGGTWDATVMNKSLSSSLGRFQGSIGYMAPELILSGYYYPGTDIFAVGVVLYLLLTGIHPFKDNSLALTFINTISKSHSVTDLDGPEWEGVSEDAKSVVSAMLNPELDDRATTEELLSHPWVKYLGSPRPAGVEYGDLGHFQNSAYLRNMYEAQVNTKVVRHRTADGSSSSPEKDVRFQADVRAGGRSTLASNEPSLGHGGEAMKVGPAHEGDRNFSLSSVPSADTSEYYLHQHSFPPTKATAMKTTVRVPDSDDDTDGSDNDEDDKSNKLLSSKTIVPEGTALHRKQHEKKDHNYSTALINGLSRLKSFVRNRKAEKLAQTLVGVHPQVSSTAMHISNTAYDKDNDDNNNILTGHPSQLEKTESKQKKIATYTKHHGALQERHDVSHERQMLHQLKRHDSLSFSTLTAELFSTNNNNNNNNKSTDEQQFDLHIHRVAAYLERSLSCVFRTFGDPQHRISLAQFMVVIRHFGLLPKAAESETSSLGLVSLLLCRFLDRDRDGLVSAEDVMALQYAVQHKQQHLLRLVFRIYSEALWYPGKIANRYHAALHTSMQPTPVKAAGTPLSTTHVPVSLLHVNTADIGRGPEFITAKHVAAVFKEFGLDSSKAKNIFNSLAGILQSIRTIDALDDISLDASTPISHDCKEGADDDESDDDDDEEMLLSLSPAVMLGSDAAMEHYSTPNLEHAHSVPGSVLPPAAAVSATHNKSHNQNSRETLTKSSRKMGNTAKPARLAKHFSVQDFVKVSEVDDVLVQALLRHSLHRLDEGINDMLKGESLTDATHGHSHGHRHEHGSGHEKKHGGYCICNELEEALHSELFSRGPAVPSPAANL